MPPRPRSRRLRSPLAVLAGATLLGLLGACGGPATGGGGTLRPGGADGPGDHLRLEGTPYQVGWWQGHLLRERALALHEGWQRDAFAADGDLASPATQERRRQALLLVDPVLPLLPETVREELQGLSDATGLPVRTLLLTELLTDVLRFTEREPRLLGDASSRRFPELSNSKAILSSLAHSTGQATYRFRGLPVGTVRVGRRWVKWARELPLRFSSLTGNSSRAETFRLVSVVNATVFAFGIMAHGTP